MKRKVKVIDNVSKKTLEGEIEIRNLLHLEVQQKNKAQIFKNRKAYSRKKKHKNKEN